MQYRDAQRDYLKACRRYSKEGTNAARRAMQDAARRVDEAFARVFPYVPQGRRVPLIID